MKKKRLKSSVKKVLLFSFSFVLLFISMFSLKSRLSPQLEDNYKYVIEKNSESKVVIEQENKDYNILTGQKFDLTTEEGKKEKEFEIDNNNLIRSCYKYFLFRLSYIFDEQKNKYEKISYENDSRLNQVLFSLFCQKLFVIITVDENEHEQEIFDTINSAGIRLSCTDIIKNKLYEKYKFYVNSPDETLEFYNNTWQQTFETADKYEF